MESQNKYGIISNIIEIIRKVFCYNLKFSIENIYKPLFTLLKNNKSLIFVIHM